MDYYEKMAKSGIRRIPKTRADQLELLKFYNRRVRESHPNYRPAQLEIDKKEYPQEYE